MGRYEICVKLHENDPESFVFVSSLSWPCTFQTYSLSMRLKLVYGDDWQLARVCGAPQSLSMTSARAIRHSSQKLTEPTADVVCHRKLGETTLIGIPKPHRQ